MATLTEEQYDQISRLLDKLGVLPGNVYTLDDLKALILLPSKGRMWVQIDIGLYPDSKEADFEKYGFSLERTFRDFEEKEEEGKETEEERQKAEREEEWIRVMHRRRRRRDRRDRKEGGEKGRRQGRGDQTEYGGGKKQ